METKFVFSVVLDSKNTRFRLKEILVLFISMRLKTSISFLQ